MRKRLFWMVLMGICLAGISAETWAHYTAAAVSHNVITTNSIDISVEEWQQTNQGLRPYPKDPIPVLPGTEVSKIVAVRNEGAESYIRASLTVAVHDQQGNTEVLTDDEASGWLSLEMNSDSWHRKPEDSNWWYYNNAVAEGESTAPLFRKVIFRGSEMDNRFQNSTVEIRVNAQAVQSDNNSASVLAAEGWPES